MCVFIGQLGVSDLDGGGNPKLWCAMANGKVLVFDATSWSMQHSSVQVGTSRLVSGDVCYVACLLPVM